MEGKDRSGRRSSCVRRGVFAAAILAAVFAQGPLVQAEPLPPNVQGLVDKGIAAARQQEWLLALQQFDAAFDKSPGSPETVFNLALANDRMGGHELRAITWYRAYLALAPAAANREQVAARIAALETVVHGEARLLVQKAAAANAQLPPNDRANGLYAITTAEARADDPAAVVATIAGAGGPTVLDPEAAYANITQEFAKLGNLGAAEDALRRIATPDKRDDALLGIVTGSIDAERITEALAYAKTINGFRRLLAYDRIAKHQIDKKDQAGAKQTLELALEAYRAMDKNTHANNVGELIGIAGAVDEVDLAKRLYNEISWTGDALKYNRPSASSALALVLIKAGRYGEADVLIPTISHDPNDWWRRSPAMTLAQARSTQFDKLVRDGKLAQAESFLAKLPRGEQTLRDHIRIVDAYHNAGNDAAAKRILVAAEKNVVSGKAHAAAHAADLIDFIRPYINVGDETDARRLLDELTKPGILKGIAAGKNGEGLVRSMTEQYVRLAGVHADKGDIAGARAMAVKAIKTAASIKDLAARTSELLPLRSRAVKLGVASELMASVEGGARISNRDNIYSAIGEGRATAGDLTEVLSIASKIGDSSARVRLLEIAIEQRAKVADWQGAERLAGADPALSARLTAKVAVEMVQAGLLAEAAALEPKFMSTPSGERSIYLSWLISARADRGDADAAIKVVLQRSTPWEHVTGLAGVASTVNTYSGPKAAAPIVARTVELVRNLAVPERASLCASAYGFLETLDAGAATYELAQACLRDALAVSDRAARLRQIQKAIDLMVAADRPAPRFVLSRIMADAAPIKSEYERHSAISSAMSALDKSGAKETFNALWRDARQLDEQTEFGNKARAFAEAGNTAAARDIIARWTAAASKESDPDRDYTAIVRVFVTLRDFHAAAPLSAQIKGHRERFDALLALTSAMPGGDDDGELIRLVHQAAADARAVGATYYLSNLGVNAARAGDTELAKSLIDEGDETYRENAYVSVAMSLLRAGKTDAVGPWIDKIEAAYAADGVARHWLHAGTLATILAWTRDTKRLDTLLASTSNESVLLPALMGAADGFAKAKWPEAAREALRRALALLKVLRPDFDGWVAQRIAIAEAEVDPAKAIADIAAVPDEHLRASGAVEIAKQFVAAAKDAYAVELLRKIPADSLLDPSLKSAARSAVAEGKLADARALAGKISDPVLRDDAYRFVVLLEARRNETMAALADAEAIADPGTRGYVLSDLGALFVEQQNPEWAKTADAAALRLAGSLREPLVKADLLSAVARNEARTGAAGASDARVQAIAAAQAVPEAGARAAALRWADDGKLGAFWDEDPRVKLGSEVRSKWYGYINYDLKDVLYTGLDPFLHSLASKDAPTIVNSLASAAGQLETRLRELRKMSADWSASHEIAAH